ncbi:tetratricopeptide repeat protein [Alteromonas sp. 07-89-2]|uniref:alpha/beta hydrolase-fold protein n=1 Tax=Alteromonas sp. 07-89-2 TaxID=2607609 RepID=UPI00148E8F1F|nr:alpha/beta hydrolase-fold protein [Alteromonas sp. 07-89-2]NOH59282.1 tetratricopeptide repeat protein [Alteromonas sp. 07-89-2]
MKSQIHIIIALLFLAFTSLPANSETGSDSQHYELRVEKLQSKVLNEQREVVVQLPKGYAENPDKKYPVIYRLDGAGNLTMMNAVLESLQSQNAAPEVIIVAIENTDRLRDLYPTANEDPNGPVGYGGGGANFLSFITTELMPMVEKKYRVHDFRVIEGASAGGVFALYALTQKPELFNAALTYSAAVWWNYGASAKSTVAFLKSANQLDHFIYTSIGNEGAPMRPYYNDMISGMRANQPAGLRWENEAYEGVTHNLVSAASTFSAYHHLFLSAYLRPQQFSGDIKSIKDYYARVSKQRGEKLDAPEWVIRELGYHYVGKQNYDKAIALFKYDIAEYPQTPDAYNGLAYGYEQMGEYKKALESVNQALALSTSEHDGHQVYVNRQKRLQSLLKE